MKLVIAEKPSVGAAIAAVMGANEKRSGYFEGGGYLVSWCIGHLISLADAATYNEQFRKWKYDDLPIVPQEWQFIVASGKEQQFSILKDLMHRSDVTEIINACDSGREGELIFRFVYEQANCKKPFSRLWISSMEASAIREGFSNLKDGRGYDNLYQSALCRAKADWLIGINATRLFSIFFRQGKNTTSVRRISKENFGRRSEKPPSHSCETRSTRSYFFGFERKRTRAAFHNGRIRKRLFPFSSVRL